MSNKNKWVVATGNPFDGVSLFGPFDDMEEARKWGEEHSDVFDWWFVELNATEEETK